eukprot:TRINITY_DN2181_c0_g2_i1.p1 TRINITY_DN2181_c0_g2~~TRINITY_DN2181_c0_g2_i1.p1  ORF type:complete len:606 (+),score=173.33 TRINITY_DN2181_c0_g2_i1:50-1867(+)
MDPVILAVVLSVAVMLALFGCLLAWKYVSGNSVIEDKYVCSLASMKRMEEGTPAKAVPLENSHVRCVARSPSLASALSWSDEAASSPSSLTALMYPECANEVFYDWGPGIASCSICTSRPILNRGCKMCGKRMCNACFLAHKEEKLSIFEIALFAIRIYGSPGSIGLTPEQYQTLLSDLGIQGGDPGSDPSSVDRDGIIAFLQTKPHLVPVLNRILKQHAINLASFKQRGMGTPECAEEKGWHDWGPGIAICAMCSNRSLNRGCRRCGKRLCEKCFMLHMQMAKLAAAAMSGRLDTSDPLEESKVVSDTASAVERGTSVEPNNARQVPPDMAVHCPLKATRKVAYKVVETVNFFEDATHIPLLSEGGALYHCTCKEGFKLSQEQLKMIASFVNISGFKDELAENSVSYLDPFTEEAQLHIYLLNKGMYVFPPSVRVADLNSKVLSSVAFHRACQPGSGMKKPKVWTDVAEPNTFRLTKPIIPLVWGVTFQLKTSVVPPHLYPGLSVLCDGLTVHHAVLMERTKRVKSGTDSTLKLKSILVYHFLPKGGMIVTNVTAAANSSVPKVAAAIVDKLGSLGAAEVYETAERTRTYLAQLATQSGGDSTG